MRIMVVWLMAPKPFPMKKWLYDSRTFGGPFLIQIYNIEPLFAGEIETTKVNTV